MTTVKKYWNEPEALIGHTCFLLTCATPIVHTIASLANVAYRIAKVFTLSHFWIDMDVRKPYSFKERLKDAGKDLLGAIIAPNSTRHTMGISKKE